MRSWRACAAVDRGVLHDLSFYEDVVGFAKYCATLKMRCDHGCLACDRASEPTRHLRGEVDIKLSAGAQRATVFCEVSKCGDLVTMAFKNDSSPDAPPACAPCTLDLAAQGNLVQRSTIPGSAEDELEVLVPGCQARVLFVGAPLPLPKASRRSSADAGGLTTRFAGPAQATHWRSGRTCLDCRRTMAMLPTRRGREGRERGRVPRSW